MQSADTLVRLFREQGLRITPQRRAIFELLADDDSHPTAEEVFQRLSSRMPDISRTTVYNTIRELVALGELVEVEDISVAGTRYDTRTGIHHHLLCLGCHALLDIAHDFEGLDLSTEETSGYQMIRRQVTFYGYCPACQRERQRKAPPEKGGAPDKS
jgi:Fe2+ or Zn2+ uptake regulation protein